MMKKMDGPLWPTNERPIPRALVMGCGAFVKCFEIPSGVSHYSGEGYCWVTSHFDEKASNSNKNMIQRSIRRCILREMHLSKSDKNQYVHILMNSKKYSLTTNFMCTHVLESMDNKQKRRKISAYQRSNFFQLEYVLYFYCWEVG
jgi:hypothetical protein